MSASLCLVFSLLIVWEAAGSYQVFVDIVFEWAMSLRNALQFNSRMAVADKTETVNMFTGTEVSDLVYLTQKTNMGLLD